MYKNWLLLLKAVVPFFVHWYLISVLLIQSAFLSFLMPVVALDYEALEHNCDPVYKTKINQHV